MPEQPLTTAPAPRSGPSTGPGSIPRDVIDELAGLSQSESAQLRSHRPDSVLHAQESYDAIFPAGDGPDSVAGFGLPLRLFAAARAAQLEDHAPTETHYAGRLAKVEPRLAALLREGADGASPKEHAILAHVELLTRRPGDAAREDLAALQEAGMAGNEILMLSQTVSFVSFQLRLAHGLAVLKEQL